MIGCIGNGGKPPEVISWPMAAVAYGYRMFGHWVPSIASRICSSKPDRPNTPDCSTSARYAVLPFKVQVTVMPRLTSNAASARRFTFWLSFICRSG